jgi:hypothetical protein
MLERKCATKKDWNFGANTSDSFNIIMCLPTCP